jgi:peptidoglycan/LPS O-acetylase OafA/YrhL
LGYYRERFNPPTQRQIVEASGTSTARSRPENAFDFIRIVAAFGVLFSHSFALLGHHEPTFYGGQSLGGLSVFVFFAVSGYLVMTSWDRAESARVFAVNRGLRIFPGLIVCLLLCAFVLGPAATVSPLSSYFGSAQPYLFVATNVVMFTDHVVISLPGMFRDLPIANAINGSLWTIPYEIFMYATLLAAVCATRRRTLIITSLLVAYVMIWAIGTYNRPSDPGALLWRLGAINLTGKHLLNLAPFFLVGALIARAPRRFLNSKIAVIFAAASLVFNDWKFAIAVLWLALHTASSFSRLMRQKYSIASASTATFRTGRISTHFPCSRRWPITRSEAGSPSLYWLRQSRCCLRHSLGGSLSRRH